MNSPEQLIVQNNPRPEEQSKVVRGIRSTRDHGILKTDCNFVLLMVPVSPELILNGIMSRLAQHSITHMVK